MSAEPRPGEESEEVVSPFPSLLEWRQQRSPVPPAPQEPVAPATADPPTVSSRAAGRRRWWRPSRPPGTPVPPEPLPTGEPPLKPVRRPRLAQQVTVVGEPAETTEPPPTPPVEEPPGWENGEVLLVDSTVLPTDGIEDLPPQPAPPADAAGEPPLRRFHMEASSQAVADPPAAASPPPWPIPRTDHHHPSVSTPPPSPAAMVESPSEPLTTAAKPEPQVATGDSVGDAAPPAPQPPTAPASLPSPAYGHVADPTGGGPAPRSPKPPPTPDAKPLSGSGLAIPAARRPARMSRMAETVTTPRFITVAAAVVSVTAGIGLVVVLGGGTSDEAVDPATLPSPVATYTQQPASDSGPIPPDSDADLTPPVDGRYQLVVFGSTGCLGQQQVSGGGVELAVVDCEAAHSTWDVTAGDKERFGLITTDEFGGSFGACVAPVELGPDNGFRDVACDGDDRGLYYFDPVVAGVYRIRSVVSRYCLSVSSGRIVQSACQDDKATQEFRIRQVTQ